MKIELVKVHKVFGQSKETQVSALKGIDLTIQQGDFMAIVGPSGSGKTTLLNLIAGLDTASSGTVLLDDQDMGQLSLGERTAFRLNHMGFVFQSYELLPVLSAFENVELPLQLRKFPKKLVRERVEWALREVGLAHLHNRYPREMSGGQNQRVSIARALAGSPSLILADEPTANLDSQTAKEIVHLFKDLNEKHRQTFLFSTHDQRLMDEVKQIGRIKDGNITIENQKGP